MILLERGSPVLQQKKTLQWRHNEHDGVSDHQPHDCLLNRLFKHRRKKTSKLRVTGLCGGNSPETGEFPAQRASNVENVSIWWRHRGYMAIKKPRYDTLFVIWCIAPKLRGSLVQANETGSMVCLFVTIVQQMVNLVISQLNRRMYPANGKMSQNGITLNRIGLIWV